jgi:uncharacterized protein (TIGR02246 family)
MKRLIGLAAAAMVGGAVLGGAAYSETQRPSNQADEEAIRRVIVEMTEGFNSHSGRAASRMYTSDARLVTVRGEVMNGQAEIEKGLSAIFATRARNATHQTQNVAIRFLRPDIALAHVTNELSGIVSADGQALPSHQELSLRVFAKEDGEWRVAAFHNTMIAPFGGRPK